jgi:hypothetical protein
VRRRCWGEDVGRGQTVHGNVRMHVAEGAAWSPATRSQTERTPRSLSCRPHSVDGLRAKGFDLVILDTMLGPRAVPWPGHIPEGGS